MNKWKVDPLDREELARDMLRDAAPELAEALRIFETAYQTGRNEPLVIASEHARTVLARLEGK